MVNREAVESPREIVLDMLIKTLEEGKFSHLVKKEVLYAKPLETRELLFAERLFQGVLEKVIFLDWIIASYSSVKIDKMKPVIRCILRMSIFEMLFMDSVPDHAAVNEAVKLTKKKGLKGLVPFVNGLLRSFQRGGIRPGMPEHVKHSAPLWLYKKEVAELGKDRADRFFDAVSEEAVLYARISLSRGKASEICGMLEREGCRAEPVPGVEEAVTLSGFRRLSDLTAFQEGLIYLQDLSSIFVGKTAKKAAEKIEVKKILDVCAAPGGKSLHLAELFPEAEVCARDLSPEKTALIEENIRRSRLKNIRAQVQDALVFDESCREQMDLVLCDLPCSGLGVIGRKPEIRLRVKEEDLASLSLLQRSILKTSADYVCPGGLLIYSTCTVNRGENQENADWFSKEFPFKLEEERQFLPGEDRCDGFYLSLFRKEG